MLTITDAMLERELNYFASVAHKSISQVLFDALALYAEQQEDAECLAIIAQREHEPTVSYEDVLVGLKKDGLI